MDELFDITIQRESKSRMIDSASNELNRFLSTLIHPINEEKDIIRLRKYTRIEDQIKLIYEISRDARPSRNRQNRSPYKEVGFVMQVGRNIEPG